MAAPRDRRANQKQRTRAAIVEAAARLLRSGVAPSVADAAEEAKVSRATAYRYFPTPESLHLEVAGVTPAYAAIEQLARTMEGGEPTERLTRLQQTLNATTFGDEAQMRMALKVYLDTWFAARGGAGAAPEVREGRRMRWLDLVLAPMRDDLTDAQWRRVTAALALTMGAEAMIVMKDVCRLGDAEAQDALTWAAQTLLSAGLSEAAPAPARNMPPRGG